MEKGNTYRQTGDVNLAAALMACGIPLSTEIPVRLIERESAKPYASFNLAQGSNDGVNQTDTLMAYWSSSRGLAESHPFVAICRFIRSKPLPSMSSDDWFSYAIDAISEMGEELPGLRTYADIDAFVQRLPLRISSYILAFVANRKLCFDLFKKCRRAVHMQRHGSHAIIDTNLPKWQRDEILKRF